MNILMVRSDLKRAGPGISIYRLSHQLRDHGMNIVIISSGGELSEIMKQEGFTVHDVTGLEVGGRNLFALWRAVKRLRRVVVDEQIDVVHSHNMISTFLTRLACFGLKGRRHRYFTSIHGKGREWLFKYTPGTLVGVSHDQMNYVLAHAPEKPVYCLYATNPWLSESPRELRSREPLRLISVAHFTGLKGHDRLIAMCRILRAREVSFYLKLVGDGPTRPEIVALIEAEGLDPYIEFLGARDDIRTLLESSDIFVHLPDYETFGIACQEALCCGLPIVVSKVGGLPELATSSEFSALISLPKNNMAAEAADAIINFSKPEVYANASALALQSVARFAPEKIIDDLIKAFDGDKRPLSTKDNEQFPS